MVFELLAGGNLERFSRQRTTPLSEDVILSIFRQLLSAAHHMHLNGFLHRDIKPENILLKSNSTKRGVHIKLADLGLAKRCSAATSRPHTTYVATRWYRSPEILLRISNYSYPSDIWAIGVVMAEIVNLGQPIFPGENEDDQLSRIVSLRGHPSIVGWKDGETALKRRRIKLAKVTASSLQTILPRASLPILQLIGDLLQLDPTLRPTALEALSYPLFNFKLLDSPLQSRPRKRQKLEYHEGDTARTRDFPSSGWSTRSEECNEEDYNEDAIQPSIPRSRKGIEQNPLSQRDPVPPLDFKMVHVPRFIIPPQSHADQHQTPASHSTTARRRPAGSFDMRSLV